MHLHLRKTSRPLAPPSPGENAAPPTLPSGAAHLQPSTGAPGRATDAQAGRSTCMNPGETTGSDHHRQSGASLRPANPSPVTVTDVQLAWAKNLPGEITLADLHRAMLAAAWRGDTVMVERYRLFARAYVYRAQKDARQ